jgi:hypothetical protein
MLRGGICNLNPSTLSATNHYTEAAAPLITSNLKFALPHCNVFLALPYDEILVIFGELVWG